MNLPSCCALALALAAAPLHADVKLPSLFSDHAVLQHAAKVPVWGQAAPGEKVRVILDKASAEAVASADGKWQVLLDLSTTGPGPFDMRVEGGNRIVLSDILVGEVWLCSGQSNMEFQLSKGVNTEKEIASSTNPQLRQFLVKHRASASPVEQCEGTWMMAGPQTSGLFTAVGYFFGKTLQKTLGRPVAIINSSWGGTPIEAWMSPAALAATPAIKTESDQILADAASLPSRQREFLRQFNEWAKAGDRADRPSTSDSFAGISVDESDWKTVKLPGSFVDRGLPASGAVWFRRKVTVPSGAAGKPLELRLGVCGDFDQVFWNGEKVGETSPERAGAADQRSYQIPAPLVHEGEAVLALRLYSPRDKGGVNLFNATFQAGSIPLAGPWLAKVEYELPKLSNADCPTPLGKPLSESNLPTYLYHAMIQPLAPYAIAGVLWYQGEHNAPHAFQYRDELPALIAAWRELWSSDLPFYLCQLPNFLPKKNTPEESPWAEMRESQSKALALPHTGMAVLVDAGEEGDIHPRDKHLPGERLAALALAKTYHQDVPCGGPAYQSMTIADGKIRLHFADVGKGLIASTLPATYEKKSSVPSTTPLVRNSPGSDLEGFAICGDDKKWRWAGAKIDGETVLVWSDQVTHPVAVRYAWASNPTCNLWSADGFPAAPFRTDEFPLSTQPR